MTDIPVQDPRLRVEAHVDASPDIPDQGERYLHCPRCLDEWEESFQGSCTPQQYARQQVAITKEGQIQTWCTRHDQNVCMFTLRAVRSTAKGGSR